MNDSDKLKKIIERAIEGGWDLFGNPGAPWEIVKPGTRNISLEITEGWVPPGSLLIVEAFDNRYVQPWYIIFDHSFLKAFFGEREPLTNNDDEPWKGQKCLHCKGDPKIANPSGFCSHIHYPDACDICKAKREDWQHHAQQLVLKENRIDYLFSFLTPPINLPEA